MNPYDDGIGLDEYVDWLIDAGYPIQRIADYDDWLQRFETACGPCRNSNASTRCCHCCTPTSNPRSRSAGRSASTDRFRSAVQEAKIGPDKDIPHVTPPIIVKYITDLQLLGLL